MRFGHECQKSQNNRAVNKLKLASPLTYQLGGRWSGLQGQKPRSSPFLVLLSLYPKSIIQSNHCSSALHIHFPASKKEKKGQEGASPSHCEESPNSCAHHVSMSLVRTQSQTELPQGWCHGLFQVVMCPARCQELHRYRRRGVDGRISVDN
jgi:hypothetical protein